MAAAAKYQVFISSTYEDLKEERDQVIRAVLEMGHIPVGMEMFSAADDEQWQIIARHIEESDYYAVIAAHRLGSLTEEGISYTRKEYEYARDKGIPRLGFLLDETTRWPADRVDTNSRSQKGLQEFKALIREKPVSFWSSAEDLYGKFSVALMKAITANPREGWIRASNAGSAPEVTAEVIRLSAENAKLRQQVESARDAADKEHKEGLKQAIDTMMATKTTLSYRYTPGGEWHTDVEISLLRAYLTLGQEMMVEASIEDMARMLAMDIRTDQDQGWDIVAVNQVKGLMADFMTLDLVQPSSRKHAVSDTNEYWTLTAAGIEVLKLTRRVALKDRVEEAPEDEPTLAADGDEGSGEAAAQDGSKGDSAKAS